MKIDLETGNEHHLVTTLLYCEMCTPPPRSAMDAVFLDPKFAYPLMTFGLGMRVGMGMGLGMGLGLGMVMGLELGLRLGFRIRIWVHGPDLDFGSGHTSASQKLNKLNQEPDLLICLDGLDASPPSNHAHYALDEVHSIPLDGQCGRG